MPGQHQQLTDGRLDVGIGRTALAPPVQPCQQHGDPVDAGGHLLATTHASASPAATCYRPR